MTRRVVITGIGIVSSLGCSTNSFWEALRLGRNGISRVHAFDTTSYKKHFGGEVKGFPVGQLLSVAEQRVYGRASQFAIFATFQALTDSNLPNLLFWEELRSRIATIIGTTFGEAQIIELANQVYIDSTSHLKKCKEENISNLDQYNPSSLSVNVAKRFGFSGPNAVIPTACAAGNHAIGLGVSLIKSRRADVVVSGGADPFSRVAFSGFARLGVMADEKCQPFDKQRKGMLVGEGAGMIVLEDYELAVSRKAKIYAEVLGLGLSCDAKHMTIPDIEGMMHSMTRAIKNAGLSTKDVDYICAHGTGTIMNDRTESAAIRKLFYENGNAVPVSSIKSMLGHSMGAASALETIACVLAIQKGEIPPTANHEAADPECDIDCVPNRARQKVLNVVLNNSFAFGGNNACLALAKV